MIHIATSIVPVLNDTNHSPPDKGMIIDILVIPPTNTNTPESPVPINNNFIAFSNFPPLNIADIKNAAIVIKKYEPLKHKKLNYYI
jgi:hypothetical protein